MKTSMFILSLLFTVTAFAKTPATIALNNLLADGVYTGQTSGSTCEVLVSTKNSAATVTIKSLQDTETFVLLNSSLHYSVNDSTGEIAATQNLKFPHYLNGGTKILNVKPIDTNEINFSISTILLDHRGNDASSYLDCRLSF